MTIEALTKLLDDRENKMFANLRRAGVLKQDAKDPKTPPGDSPAANTSSSQLDPQRYRTLDRTLSRSGLASKLSERQYSRLERDFAAENPDDVEGWVKEYFEGLGGSQPAAASAAQPHAPAQPQQPQNARPVSDSPPPPAARVPLEEQDILTLSPSDRDKLLKEKGLKWFTDAYAKAVSGRSFKLTR